jgi:3-isopropylmalate/(R)-2-methylmalate dehydratase small subunit
MKPIIRGKAYVLGDHIDTDQIIPAQHLVYSLNDPEERKRYGQYALSGVPEAQAGLPDGHHPFVKEGHTSPYTVIVAGKNFGCGSSREHAPAALQIAGVEAVVAESYARIFYRNTIDGGFLVPFESTESLWRRIRTGDTVEIDTSVGTLLIDGRPYALRPLGAVEAILRAGDVFAYARQSGLLR